jgi:broad specificity phosphatase PhoE
MSFRLLLIRHGETVWNQEGRFQGFSDISLNARGEEQAGALARALRDVPLAAVFSSDLVRARRTAEVVAAEHGLTVHTDARLRELNQGRLEGKSMTALLSEEPELWKQWIKGPADVVMPGGESLRSLQGRAWTAVCDIRQLYTNHTVAIVSHNLASRAIICKALDLDLNRFRRLRIDTASLSEIHFPEYGPVIVRLNDLNHLHPKG